MTNKLLKIHLENKMNLLHQKEKVPIAGPIFSQQVLMAPEPENEIKEMAIFFMKREGSDLPT